MKTAILGRSEKLLKDLELEIESAGHEVGLCQIRKPDVPLTSQLRDIHPDLLLLDASCEPDGDLSAVEALTRASPAMAVLMLSPRRDSDSLLASMRAGVREVLHSPPSTAELTEALRRVERRRKQETAGGARDRLHPVQGR